MAVNKLNIVRMKNFELSVLIPARHEMFLAKTVEDILQNSSEKTEIIVVLDGEDANPPIPQHPRLSVVVLPESIGQRAATNLACKLSNAKYVMKCDAHCAFDKDFDIKMMNEMSDDVTMVPLMKNLHAFDWVCPEGHRRYQGPSGPCNDCGKETVRDVIWQAKQSPNSVSYCFDSTPHFQYFGEFSKRPEGMGEVTETMSLQGSCWMMTRAKYWELNICDENFGSWGSQGIEVAVKTWLSGGRVLVNKKTWYAHMFRTQGGDFSFPYPIKGSDQERAKTYARDLFFNNRWDKQIRPLSWLVEKFWPVKGWSEEDLQKLKSNTFRFSENLDGAKPAHSEAEKEIPLNTSDDLYNANRSGSDNFIEPKVDRDAPKKGIIFYTDNQLNLKIAHSVQRQLGKIATAKNIPIVSVSLKPMSFGMNTYLPLKRGHLAMFTQILTALEASTADIIYFCEADVLYHPSHFDFTPSDKNTFYYNQNVWYLRSTDGHGLHFNVNQLSGLCVYREAAIIHFKERFEMVKNAFETMNEQDYGRFIRNMGFEPMTHHRVRWKNQFSLGTWKAEFPNIDVRHGANTTGQRWRKDQYKNQQLLVDWTETDDEIPGWGKTAELIKKWN